MICLLFEIGKDTDEMDGTGMSQVNKRRHREERCLVIWCSTVGNILSGYIYLLVTTWYNSTLSAYNDESI